MNVVDFVIHSTVRIESVLSDGSIATGTGFFFRFLENDQEYVPCLITNKHVLKDAKMGRVYVTPQDSEGKPNFGQHLPWYIDGFEDKCIGHPDKNVDLAVFPIGNLINTNIATGAKPFYTSFGIKDLPSTDFLNDLKAVEDILMVGYPNGIWDSHNNVPIVRRGITATPYYLNYENKEEFLIDAACFPGSSGSPIFLINEGSYSKKNGGMVIGTRHALLGILYAGPQHTAEGEIKIIDVPTKATSIVSSSIPNNLGLCIKSNKLLDFEPLLQK